jgi:hypothetical protein
LLLGNDEQNFDFDKRERYQPEGPSPKALPGKAKSTDSNLAGSETRIRFSLSIPIDFNRE